MTTQTRLRVRSSTLHERACGVLVRGVNSPVRAFQAVGGEPVLVDHAEGASIYDVDGNRYRDLVGSWGAAIVGHAHPEVVAAVREAAAGGLSFGASCEAEIELAELIVSAVPGAETIRFVNSGTEAVMSAVRLARGVTGRNRIVKFSGCYHGHADPFLVAAGSGAAMFGHPSSAGVPASAVSDTLVAEFNALEQVQTLAEEHPDSIAAIVVEPIAGNMGMIMPENGFLAGLRAVCDDIGALLVYDEVMTGFRVAWGGCQQLGSVRADLTCMGKVIGGGMPVAAYMGRRELMEHVSPAGPVYQAGTLSGNPLGMAAGLATLRMCQRMGFYEGLYEHARTLACSLKESAEAAGVALQTVALGGMLGMFFSDEHVSTFKQAQACDHDAFGRFFCHMLERGVWLPPSSYEAMFVSAAHRPEDITHVLEAAAESFAASKADA